LSFSNPHWLLDPSSLKIAEDSRSVARPAWPPTRLTGKRKAVQTPPHARVEPATY